MKRGTVGFIALVIVAHCFLGCSSRPTQYCGDPIAPRDTTPRHVTILAEDLSPLRTAFNSTAHQWRVVALVSPTCSECILGAEAVKQEITARYHATQVPALIVWIPMLANDSEQTACSAATIFPPQGASQFYDSEQTVGNQYSQQTFSGFFTRARKSVSNDHWLANALDDRSENQRPQWDLYMLYAPGIRWDNSSDSPPMPTHWIRHLGRTEDGSVSTYWQDTPESGPRVGNLFDAIRTMAEQAIGAPSQSSTGMTIEVLGFEGCPNTPQMKADVEKAAATLNLAADVLYVDQLKLAENDPRRGWLSPTVLVDGHDLFGMAAPTSGAMGCRVYEGGVPSEAKIAAALRVFAD